MRSNDGANKPHRAPVACAKWASNLGAKRFAYAAAVDATDAAANSHADRTADAGSYLATIVGALVDPNVRAFSLSHAIAEPRADIDSVAGAFTAPESDPDVRTFGGPHAAAQPCADADTDASAFANPDVPPLTGAVAPAEPRANTSTKSTAVAGTLLIVLVWLLSSFKYISHGADRRFIDCLLVVFLDIYLTVSVYRRGCLYLLAGSDSAPFSASYARTDTCAYVEPLSFADP